MTKNWPRISGRSDRCQTAMFAHGLARARQPCLRSLIMLRQPARDISGGDLRKGMVIRQNAQMLKVVSAKRVLNNREAHIRVELKDILTGKKNELRAGPSDDYEQLYFKEIAYQLLYKDDTTLYFMNSADFEQIDVPIDLCDHASFLSDGMDVSLNMLEGACMSVIMPASTNLEVVSVEKQGGDSLAVLPNGVKVHVPDFVSAGTVITVGLANGVEYKGRA